MLLKLREGAEYKLVLNMQQYPPENITVKLNERELTVLAHGAKGETVRERERIGRHSLYFPVFSSRIMRKGWCLCLGLHLQALWRRKNSLLFGNFFSLDSCKCLKFG